MIAYRLRNIPYFVNYRVRYAVSTSILTLVLIQNIHNFVSVNATMSSSNHFSKITANNGKAMKPLSKHINAQLLIIVQHAK